MHGSAYTYHTDHDGELVAYWAALWRTGIEATRQCPTPVDRSAVAASWMRLGPFAVTGVRARCWSESTDSDRKGGVI